MRISVTDATDLWRAAAAHALSYESDQGDVEDVLGPMEDPSIADCLAMLIGPRNVPGCRFDSFVLIPEVNGQSRKPVISDKKIQSKQQKTPEQPSLPLKH